MEGRRDLSRKSSKMMMRKEAEKQKGDEIAVGC